MGKWAKWADGAGGRWAVPDGPHFPYPDQESAPKKTKQEAFKFRRVVAVLCFFYVVELGIFIIVFKRTKTSKRPPWKRLSLLWNAT